MINDIGQVFGPARFVFSIDGTAVGTPRPSSPAGGGRRGC